MIPRPPHTPLFPYTTLFRSEHCCASIAETSGASSRGNERPIRPCRRVTSTRRQPIAWPHSASRRFRNGAKRCSRSEEHTSELQSHSDLVCRLLLEKKKKN